MTTATALPQPTAIQAALAQRKDWLAERQRGIGGSDAAAVLGVSPWKTEFELWAEKVGLVEPADLSSKEDVEWGLRLERPISEALEEKSGRAVFLAPPFTHIRHPERPWMCCTLDGQLSDDTLGMGVLQIKTTSAYHAGDWSDEPPLHYLVQVQHEMAVSGLPWACLCVLIGGQRMVWRDVPRNERFIAALVEKEQEFWRMVETETPPEVDGTQGCRAALKAMFPQDDESTVALPPEAVEWDAELCEVKALMADLEPRRLLAENRIKAALGDSLFGILPDGSRYSYKTQHVEGHFVDGFSKRVLLRLKGKK